MTDIPDPITLLRHNQRAALDQQANLAIEARHLAVRVQEVRTELAVITSRVNQYRALLGAIDAARAPRPVDKTA